MVTLSIPASLAQYTEGKTRIPLEGESLRVTLNAIHDRYPRAYEQILTEPGEVRTHVNIFVNRRLVRALDGPEADLNDGDVITILPAISGG